jgi:3-hydroxyisobutyrate dehydrogenase-like beta-hydroxyacid dehydrogenase
MTGGAAGIIGAGHMGGAIARRLLKQGCALRVHDIRPEAAAALAAAGAQVMPDPAALAADCDVVLLSLPSHAEVSQVVFGERGLAGSMRPGQVLVNLTTGSVGSLPPLADLERTHGIRYVTAPVSQGVAAAEQGELTAFTAGTRDGLAGAEPVLRDFCSTVIRLDSHRAAMTAKLVTNLAWAISAAALPELLGVLGWAGIPPARAAEVLAASCGGSWVAEHDIPHVVDGSYDPSFTLGLLCKDLDLIREVAGAAGVRVEVGGAAEAVFRRALGVFGPDAPELSHVRLVGRPGVEPGTVRLKVSRSAIELTARCLY